MSDLSQRIANLSPSKRMLLGLCLGKNETGVQPIAIIGLGCRFPGADNPEGFWQLLHEGRHAIREVPSDRWDVNTFYDPDPAQPGKMTTRWAGLLDQVDHFDAAFFGITPREAARMDPQQRLLLEVTWQALEYAGLAPHRLAGSKTGVFIGVSGRDYSQYQANYCAYDRVDAYDGTGNAGSIAANRLSYLLDVRGPSFAVDTACSSALYAIHLACRSLMLGESDLALAGGVNLLLSPEVTIAFSKARMMSPVGRCKTFDASADGYVRGEGCGIVVLKRLADALKDNDRIWALVRGSAVNHDGRTMGLTMPNGAAQKAAIHQALANAEVQPADVDYFEAHGTATPLGDRIEVQALAEVLGPAQPGSPPHVLGAVKTNIGHLEAAAGVASLIKVVLCLQHGEIPQHLNLKEINPLVAPCLRDAGLVIPCHAAHPWPASTRRRLAGVSSFGFGGANAHLIVEEAPASGVAERGLERPLHLLTLSAKTDTALKELARSYERHLEKDPDAPLADVCFTANAGRSHFDHRLALAADSPSQCRTLLGALVAGQTPAGVHVGHAPGWKKPKVAFLFTGQGAQYPGMGRQLYETQPTFRKVLDNCNEVLRPYLERPLLEVLHPQPEQAGLLNETAYTQPALFALEYALAQLWLSWGIAPDVLLGHSIGEYVAACVSGVFSLEQGLRLVVERARRMQSCPPDGMMAAVLAGSEQVAIALASHQGETAIAAANSPTNTVISGRRPVIEEVLRDLQAQGIASRPLTVSHAFHSPLVDPILDDLEKVARDIPCAVPRIPLVSNLTGRVLEAGEAPNARYWRNHARQTVQFAAGMKTLEALGCGLFLEVGPGQTLLGLGRACLPQVRAAWLPSLRQGQDDWRTMLDSLAALYIHGLEVNWPGFDQDYLRRRVPLPTYPFERQRHWMDFDEPAGRPIAPAPGRNGHAAHHPLLGRRVS